MNRLRLSAPPEPKQAFIASGLKIGIHSCTVCYGDSFTVNNHFWLSLPGVDSKELDLTRRTFALAVNHLKPQMQLLTREVRPSSSAIHELSAA